MGMISVTTDASGFAVLPTQPFGEVLRELHFATATTSTAFNLLVEDQFNRGTAAGNFKAFQDKNGSVKFSAVPITSVRPVVFDPQDMAPKAGQNLAVQLGTAEARELRAVYGPYL